MRQQRWFESCPDRHFGKHGNLVSTRSCFQLEKIRINDVDRQLLGIGSCANLGAHLGHHLDREPSTSQIERVSPGAGADIYCLRCRHHDHARDLQQLGVGVHAEEVPVSMLPVVR